MSQISDLKNPWRDLLRSVPASFRGVIFHVETGGRSSGRRIVAHEYPKLNDNDAEDMGRQARRFQFSGYLVYRPSNPLYEYTSQRNKLYAALEEDGAGKLVHPVYAPKGGMLVMCERYSMTESRERGGYTQFEMQFVEAGGATLSANASQNTQSNVEKQASNVDTTHAENFGLSTGVVEPNNPQASA